jgi:AraC family transcriptional regulator
MTEVPEQGGEDNDFQTRAERNDRPHLRSRVWTPRDISIRTDDVTLASSRDTGIWDGFSVESGIYHPKELERPAMSDHYIGLGLGAPYNLWRETGGSFTMAVRPPGSSTIIPGLRPLRIRWDRPAAILCIMVSPEFLERIAEPFLPDPRRIEVVPVFSVSDLQIEYIGKALLADLECGAPSGKLFGESLATALAVHILRHYTSVPPRIPGIEHAASRRGVRIAAEYIHDNLGRDLSLRDIAVVSGVSANYLSTIFKQTTGDSLYQYIIRHRVEKAVRLLRSTDLTIAEIAQRVGFYDSSHLNRHFKRFIGVAPSVLRAKS